MTNASEVTDKLYFEMTLVFWSKCCNFAILRVLDVHLPLFIVKFFLKQNKKAPLFIRFPLCNIFCVEIHSLNMRMSFQSYFNQFSKYAIIKIGKYRNRVKILFFHCILYIV